MDGPGVAVRDAPAAAGQTSAQLRVAQHPGQGLAQVRGGLRRDQQRAVAVAEHLRQGAHPGGHHRHPQGQGQEEDPGLADVPVGHDQQIGRREVAGHVGERDVARSGGWRPAGPPGPRARRARSGLSRTGSPATTRRAAGRAARTRGPGLEQQVQPLVLADVAEEQGDLVLRLEPQVALAPPGGRRARHGARRSRTRRGGSRPPARDRPRTPRAGASDRPRSGQRPDDTSGGCVR